MQWIKHLAAALLITVAPVTLAATATNTPAAQKPTATAQTTPTPTTSPRININTANVMDLARLSGIGPVKAEAIVRFRNEHGNFSSIDDLTAVTGIGPATVEKNRELVSVN